MFERLSRRVDIAIRSAAFSGVGALFLIVGLGFLTVAAWFALATALPPAEVALIIGAGYVGLGLILFAVAAFIRAPRAPRPQERRRDSGRRSVSVRDGGRGNGAGVSHGAGCRARGRRPPPPLTAPPVHLAIAPLHVRRGAVFSV